MSEQDFRPRSLSATPQPVQERRGFPRGLLVICEARVRNQSMTAGEATREYYREQGRKQEQERIIKLLETKIATLESRGKKIKDTLFDDYRIVLKVDIDNLKGYIALIKGEK
jgi:hypothetical protein